MSDNEKTNLSSDEMSDMTGSDLDGTGTDARLTLPSSAEPSKTKKKKPKKRSSETTEPAGEETGEETALKKKEKKKTSSKKKKKPKAPTQEQEPSQELDTKGDGLAKKKKKKKKSSNTETTHGEANDKTIPKKKKKPKAQSPPDSVVPNEGDLLSEKNKNKKEHKAKKEKKTRTKSPRPSREITPVLDREIEIPSTSKKMSQIDERSINSEEYNSMEYSGDAQKYRYSNHTGQKRNRRGDRPPETGRKGKRPPSDVELRGKRPSSATEKTMHESFDYYDEESQQWRYSNSTLNSNGGRYDDERGRRHHRPSRTAHRNRYPEEDEYVDVDDEDEMYMREMGYDDPTDGSLYDGYFYDHHGMDDERPSFKKVTLDLADTGIRDTKCCIISAGVVFILMTIGVSVLIGKLTKSDEW